MGPSPDQIVQWSNSFALLGWVVLILFPRRWVALFNYPKLIVPLVLGVAYGGIMLAHFALADGGFGSFSEIKTLFENDYVLAAGWIHYLGFDLFVGAWIANRSDAIGLSRLIQAPILVLTFLFGPAGYALFIFIRWGLSGVQMKELAA